MSVAPGGVVDSPAVQRFFAVSFLQTCGGLFR
jgi:hypothetical protein